MKVLQGKRVFYDNDNEYYRRQEAGAKPHDRDRIVRYRIAEAIHFLFFGGTLKYTEPTIMGKNPRFDRNVRFLDVGCRDGWSLSFLNSGCLSWPWNFFSRKKFLHACGIELCLGTVKYARSRGREVVQGDIRNLVLEEDAFDVIFSRHCLEHIDTPLNALGNMKRMLKPAGTIMLIVPEEKVDIDINKSRHSYQFRDGKELVKLVQSAGFKIINSFRRSEFIIRKRKYWYKVFAKRKYIGPELWVLATKE